MPEAFGVSFVCALIAPTSADAHERVKQLRQIAVGLGFDPGPGRVKALEPGELARLPDVVAELERARERARLTHGPEASELEHAAALRGLGAEAGGDLQTATNALGALERGLGYLPRSIARELAASARGAAA
jgi:hypothetical protein